MEVANNYKDIQDYTEIVKAFLKDKKLFNQEKDMLDLMKLRYDMYYSQIHKFLVLEQTDKAEKEIQEHLRTICAYDYPICERKIELFKQAKDRYIKLGDKEKENLSYKYMQEWLILADGFYRLLAFRSLEHFANYMESDRNDKDKIWKYSLDPYNDGGYTGVNKPFFYFFNQMVLKKDIKFISKQQATGTGKCQLPDTEVMTPNGTRLIKDLQIGDYVYSMKDNKLCERMITNKWNTFKSQIKIMANGNVQITVSPEHRLYTQRGYVMAKDMTTSDYLYRFDNGTQLFVWEQIKSIESIDEKTAMVDIEVDETHNFIANHIVSHNSVGNHYAIAWLLGVDPNNDILIVLGNPSLVSMNMNNIVDLIRNPKFVSIFPQFEKYILRTEDKYGDYTETVSDEIFSICRIKDGELTLTDSDKPLNLKVISKETSIDGIRVKYLFLDDVCRSSDAGNMKQHKKDIDNFWNSWWKRNYNTNDFYVIVGGTAYSIFDIISELINYYSKGKMKTIKEFKYAYKSMDDKCVFIKVPKIDEDLERSTYPQKFPYEDALAIKDRDYRSFMAMEQQKPLPPDNTPFYVDNLTTYDVIPEEGRSDCCWASLDSARIGYDYNSMPIFALVNGKFYLKDCLYQNEPMERMYQQIVDKIKQHKITKFVIEKNIDTSLKKLLDKMLHEQGVYYCDIIEVYSTENKIVKISNMENTIKTCIVFPANGLFAYSSQMGKFLNDVYSFSYIHKNEHDDSIDSLATFCKKLIVGNQKSNKAKILSV